jgi:hypothetical protein
VNLSSCSALGTKKILPSNYTGQAIIQSRDTISSFQLLSISKNPYKSSTDSLQYYILIKVNGLKELFILMFLLALNIAA